MECAERERLHEAMVRLADGDRSAFGPVYEAVWPLLQRFAARSLRSAADGEDVAQEALIKLFLRAGEFDPTRDALPWALGIAAYECRTFRRKAGRRREQSAGPELEDAPHSGRSPEDDVIQRDLEAAALEILGTLGRADVETVLAATRGTDRPAVPRSTFRKRLERATRRFRVAWGAKHGSG